MSSPTPQPWTAETVRLVRSVLNMHVDEILAKSAGSWRAVCSCGEFTEEVRDAAQLSHTSWSTHRAEAVLAALHEAGQLCPPAGFIVHPTRARDLTPRYEDDQ